MLPGLKLSSLACKSVFYRPEHNAKGGGGERDPIELNFEDIEIQKRNKPTDRAQIVDEINVLLSNYVYSWSYDH